MIGRAIKHHDLEKIFIKWILLYSLEKKAFEKKNGIFERTKRAFRKRLLKRPNAPSPIFLKMKYHFLRDYVKQKVEKLQDCNTEEQVAD